METAPTTAPKKDVIGIIILVIIALLIGVLVFLGVRFPKKIKSSISTLDEFLNQEEGQTEAEGDSETDKGTVTQNQSGNTNQTTVKNCGDSLSCLATAADTCTKAKSERTQVMDLFGVTMKATQYLEIKGAQGQKCNLYITNKKYDLTPGTLPEGLSEQEIAEFRAEIESMDQQYNAIEGLPGTCLFTNTELAALLRKWNRGEFSFSTTPSENDLPLDKCSGPFFEPEKYIDV